MLIVYIENNAPHSEVTFASEGYYWLSIILCPILGATLAIIIKMNIDTAVILSALIAVFYTWIGNDFSVS